MYTLKYSEDPNNRRAVILARLDTVCVLESGLEMEQECRFEYQHKFYISGHDPWSIIQIKLELRIMVGREGFHCYTSIAR